MSAVRHIPWDGAASPSSMELEERLRAEDLDFYSWSNAPFDIYAPHSHSYNKVIYCVRGSITFQLVEEGSWHRLVLGDRLELPAGVVHAAEVGDNGVVCLEAHW